MKNIDLELGINSGYFKWYKHWKYWGEFYKKSKIKVLWNVNIEQDILLSISTLCIVSK